MQIDGWRIVWVIFAAHMVGATIMRRHALTDVFWAAKQRIFRRYRDVKPSYLGHVALEVISEMYRGTKSAYFSPIVQKAQYNRYAGPSGNIVEPRLPLARLLTGSCWC